MTRISAESKLSIDTSDHNWRLLVNGNINEHVLVEAAPGEPLRYMPAFAERRHLPDDGLYPDSDIQRVVVGWSVEDTSWHLGILLDPGLAAERGSRWCELARWHDPDASTYSDIATLATQAGELLAETIGRPFTLVPPRTPGTAPRLEPKPVEPMPELPLEAGGWTLNVVQDGVLEMSRSGQWRRTRLSRLSWYSLWVVVFVLLAVSSLLSGIALPRPEFLPYLGLASAVVLLGLVLFTLYELATKPNHVYIDRNHRMISAWRGQKSVWEMRVPEIDGVYVSQVVSKNGKMKEWRGASHKEIRIFYGELNVRQTDSTFKSLFRYGSDDERTYAYPSPQDGDAILPLTTSTAYTELQGIGLTIADYLNVPAYYDRRIK